MLWINSTFLSQILHLGVNLHLVIKKKKKERKEKKEKKNLEWTSYDYETKSVWNWLNDKIRGCFGLIPPFF